MSSQTPTDLFSSQQWQQLHALLDGLEAPQALWLSGYLAARSLGQPAPAVTSSTGGHDKVCIAYGTETGNCRRLAQDLAKRCNQAGIASEVADLAQLRVRRLGKMSHVIVITATHGDGEPPEPATPFYEELMADGTPALNGVKFAVLALGDSSYEQFCVTGQAIDERLEALGGERLIARQDCDVDFEKPAAAWMEQLLAALPATSQPTPAPAAAIAPQEQAASPYSKDNPILAQVLANQNLSHPGRHLAVHHLELAVDTAQLDIVPGDAVGILAENPPQLVSLVLDAANLSGEQPVTLAGEAMPLVQALRMHRDLTIPGKGFLELWAALSGDPDLHALVKAELRVQREFLRNHQVRDIIHRAPAHPDPQALVDALRPLQPRLYDVANCLETLPDELHLTVKAYQYPFAGRIENGIATQYLLELDTDASVPLYPHKNPRFHLPDTADAPVILVAESTGIAPYRAFLQTMARRGDSPPCWLVFAEETFEEDFLYQIDIQQAVANGVLSHVDSLFYHDQSDVTLAQPLLAHSERLLSWLEQGAHIYLCGDKDSLDMCEATLKHHVDERVGKGHWKLLSGAKRIHRNLY